MVNVKRWGLFGIALCLVTGSVGCDRIMALLPQQDADSYVQKYVPTKALKLEIGDDKRTLTLIGWIRNDGDRDLSSVVVGVRPMVEGGEATEHDIGPVDAHSKRQIDPVYVGQLSKDTIYFVSQTWAVGGTFAGE